MALRSGLVLSLRRAGFHAQAATGAVFRSYLDGEFHIWKFFKLGIDGFEGLRSVFRYCRIVDFLADDSMRANKGAFTALDTQVRFPDRDFERNIAFFPLGGAGGESAIHREGADGQALAFEGNDRSQDIHYKIRGFSRNWRAAGDLAGDGCRNFDFEQVCQGVVNSVKVLFDNCFTAFAVSFLDGFLDLYNGFVRGAAHR